MYLATCVWCNSLVSVEVMPSLKQETVCSEACKQQEYSFRMLFSTSLIQQHFECEHGINLSEREARYESARSQSPPKQTWGR